MFNFWLVFGVTLLFAELVLPGLVAIFVGFGALTVAALMHFNLIEGLLPQLVTWFISSTIYIFSLRLLVIRYYPSDRVKQDINEDHVMLAKKAEVIEKVTKQKSGRIKVGELTWIAILDGNEDLEVGEEVEIVGRDNISWKVRKIVTAHKEN